MTTTALYLTAAFVAAASTAALEDRQIASFSSGVNAEGWQELNDPVMGGQSFGNFSVIDKQYGLFQGEVKNVTFLHAPGFCKVQKELFLKETIDLSEFGSDIKNSGIKLKVAYAQPEDQTPYSKYRFSLSGPNIAKSSEHERYGSYKGDFVVKADTDGACHVVTIPFNAFSSDWSDFTGECGGVDPDGRQHKCCSDSAEVCPTTEGLKKIDGLSVWAEGVEGKYALKIYEVNATASVSGDASIAKC